MTPAPQLRLINFGAPGRAEITRLLLTIGGIPFVDERIARADFPALKPTLPLGQLPTLQVDGSGTTYSQGMAIARYAAKINRLFPQDPLDALRADMVSETVVDLVNAFSAVMFVQMDEATKAEKTKMYVHETVPKMLGVLESMM